eukprot:COSAG01_NODE_309_length_19142_cov_22.748149_13_plen_33_part_00
MPVSARYFVFLPDSILLKVYFTEGMHSAVRSA